MRERLGGDELKAEFRGFLRHVLDLLFFVFLLVLVHAQRFIFHVILQHAIHHARDGVRRRHSGLRGPQPRSQAPIQRAKYAIGLLHRLRRHTKRLPGAVLRFQRLVLQDLPARDLMLGSQPQPGTKMFFVREFAHVRSNFHDDGLRQRHAKAVHD